MRQPKRANPEALIQTACAAWCASRRIRIQASKNGAYSSARVGAVYKEMGVQSGFPDMQILRIGGRGEPGLFVELKAPGRTLKPKQVQWQKDLREEGYVSEWVTSVDAFKSLVLRYIDGTGPPFEGKVVVE